MPCADDIKKKLDCADSMAPESHTASLIRILTSFTDRMRKTKVMLQTTIDAIKAILATDATIDNEERMQLIANLKRGAKAESRTPDRILRRQQAATRLGVCPKTLDNWTAQGAIRPVTIPGSTRAVGFRESDIDALIAGKPVQIAV